MTLGSMIRRRRKDLELTQDQLSAQSDISKPYLSYIETDKTKNPPTDRILKALERSLRFEPGELTRLAHIERTPPDIRDEHAMLEAEVNNLRSVLKGLLADVPRKEIGGVDLDALFHKLQDGSNVRSIHAGIAVPVINKVTAGYPHHFTDLDYPPSVADEYIRCPDLSDPQAFAARVVGDSMEPVYHEGDIVVFSPNTETRNGDDCLVRFDHDNSTTFKRIYMDDEQTVRLQPLNSAFPAETFRREQISGLWAAVFRVEKLRRV